MKSRYVQFAISGDEGKTWSEPKSLPKNPAEFSVVRHPLVELGPNEWLFSLSDTTVVYDPKTEKTTPFADGRKHGLVPIVRTPKGTLVSGAGLRSTDDGKSWQRVEPFPRIAATAGGSTWRCSATAGSWRRRCGAGVGGERWRFVVSRDDGQSWDFDGVHEFYNPGRAIGGRACPRTVMLDKETLGTVFYDVDAKQPGGPGVFFLRTRLPNFNRVESSSTLRVPFAPAPAHGVCLLLCERHTECACYSQDKPRNLMLRIIVFLALAGSGLLAQQEPVKVAIDPEKAGPDFALQGEYLGTADKEKLGAEVVACGNGTFWSTSSRRAARRRREYDKRVEASAKTADGKTTVASKDGKWSATLADGKLTGTSADGKAITLERAIRKSKTLGEKPPPGAVVLYAGPDDAEHWKNTKIVDGHLMGNETSSKRTFRTTRSIWSFASASCRSRRARGAATAASTCRAATRSRCSTASGSRA